MSSKLPNKSEVRDLNMSLSFIVLHVCQHICLSCVEFEEKQLTHF